MLLDPMVQFEFNFTHRNRKDRHYIYSEFSQNEYRSTQEKWCICSANTHDWQRESQMDPTLCKL